MQRPQQHPRLSVAMIVRDAAETIAQALASVSAVADQVVVVDTGSTDATVELAVAAGAGVHSHPWQQDFSAARNFCWSKLNSDWVLWLDSSESLTPEGATVLRQFVNTRADLGTAYTLLVQVPAAAPHMTGEQVARIRLVPNRADVRFAGCVREELDASLAAAGVEVGTLPVECPILRSPRDNEPEVKLAKARRNLRIVDLEIKQRGQQPELLIVLGEALDTLGEHSSAAASFRMALESAAPHSRLAREAYYGLLASLDADPAQRDQQISICLEALNQFPLDAQLFCAMGGYLQAQDRLELAARAFQTAYEQGQIDPRVAHATDVQEIAAICLATVLQLEQEDDRALAVLQKLLASRPNSIRARRHVIDLHIKHERRKLALDELDRLPADTPHREALRSAVRGACLAAGQNWIPALAYLQTAYAAGCRDPLCLRWLTLALLGTGEVEVAAPILREWQTQDPRNIEAQKYVEALAAGTLASGTHTPTAPPSLIPGGIKIVDGRVLRLDQPEMPERPQSTSGQFLPTMDRPPLGRS